MVIVYTSTTVLTSLSLQNCIQEGEKVTNIYFLLSIVFQPAHQKDPIAVASDIYKNQQNHHHCKRDGKCFRLLPSEAAVDQRSSP